MESLELFENHGQVEEIETAEWGPWQRIGNQSKADCFLFVLGLRSPNQSSWFLMNSSWRVLWNVAKILADSNLFCDSPVKKTMIYYYITSLASK